MARYAILDASGVVLNIAEADASWQPGAGLTTREAAAETQIGGRWTGAAWEVAPVAPRPVPASVTNFQARAALMQAPSGTQGVSLFAAIDAALRAGKDAAPEGALAWQAWEQANDFFRDGALVNTLGAQFGLTGAQIDALFREAFAIVA